jgi:hypothetical protein
VLLVTPYLGNDVSMDIHAPVNNVQKRDLQNATFKQRRNAGQYYWKYKLLGVSSRHSYLARYGV